MHYWLIFVLLFSACSNNKIQNPKAPYDGTYFANLEKLPDKSLWDVLKWRFNRESKPWPEDLQNKQFKVKAANSSGVNIVVINHATVLIQMNGINIITDPIYSQRPSPVSFLGPKRVIRPGIKFPDLPKIDYILVGHNHYDHLDLPTIRKIYERDAAKVLVGLGNKELFGSQISKSVIEMDWWDEYRADEIVINFVPSQHWSGRGIFDRKKSLWGGFVVEGDKRIYFSSDTGYGKFFTLLEKKYRPIDIAVLPIGAYEPRWFMRAHHMNPTDSIKAFIDLHAKVAIGMHFGTFNGLTDEAIDDPKKDLVKALEDKKIDQESFIVPMFGKSYLFN